ncbi:ribonuclease Z [Lonsdalea britannica]|uniref:Ribonuclease BN n=1 Tax=Lonsdalea britannica TaxID=1082704 RepID=A0AAD0SEK5_9GAMM|nr:ribonuclease Z [Lonsdalea britannica]AXW86477.1 ribonuclease [Lonsdalea britannica]OSM98741.1 ribonuclease Z [Lonsdalea britannica]OSN09671.1 ribonuclease Z [Lonsdalea britannica]
MELIFLGTSAGVPTKARNVASLALDLQGPRPAFWLFDCGEGTQHQILHTRLSASKIEKIFITHLHGDHLFGLPGLLCSRSMAGCQAPLTLYGPAGLKTFIDNALSLSGSYLTYPMEVVEVTSGPVCEDEHRVVTAYPMSHTLTCFGYRIEERPKPGALDVARLTKEGVRPGSWFQPLKRGESVTLEDGRTLNGADYLGPPTPGRSLAIFGDTRPSEAGRLLAAGVDVMVHEATVEANMADRASERGHSTTEQAATLALEAGAGRLIITHISARYGQEDSKRLLAECRAIFPATDMATDLATFRV